MTRLRQHRLRPDRAAGAAGARRRPRSATRVDGAARPRPARRPREALSPRSSPAASASASRLPARSPSSRASCSSTSPSARSTPRSAASCAAGCARSTTGPATPPSSSPTTRKRRSSSPTASSSSTRARIEQIGTPDEIYDRPASPFVAGFIGETNALPVTVESGKLFLDDRPLELASPAAAPTGRARWSSVRTTSTSLATRPGGIAGCVVSERRHGAVRRLEVEIGMAPSPHRDRRRRRRRRSRKKGDRVSVLPNRWWLFEPSEFRAAPGRR